MGAGEPYSLCKPPEKRDWEEGVPFVLSLIPLSPPPHFPFPFDSCHADQIVRKSGKTRPQLSHISFCAKMLNTFVRSSPFLGNIQALCRWFAVIVL